MDKENIYKALLPQIRSLVGVENDSVANMANIAAVLEETFGFFWVGFYVVKGEQLVLAPFQGPLACTRIAFGRGVCGTAWKEQHTLIVPDVEKFPDILPAALHRVLKLWFQSFMAMRSLR